MHRQPVEPGLARGRQLAREIEGKLAVVAQGPPVEGQAARLGTTAGLQRHRPVTERGGEGDVEGGTKGGDGEVGDAQAAAVDRQMQRRPFRGTRGGEPGHGRARHGHSGDSRQLTQVGHGQGERTVDRVGAKVGIAATGQGQAARPQTELLQRKTLRPGLPGAQVQIGMRTDDRRHRRRQGVGLGLERTVERDMPLVGIAQAHAELEPGQALGLDRQPAAPVGDRAVAGERQP